MESRQSQEIDKVVYLCLSEMDPVRLDNLRSDFRGICETQFL